MQGRGLQVSIRPLVDTFSRVSNEDHRGTWLADEVHFSPNKPPKMVTLNPDIHSLLLDLLHGTPTFGSNFGSNTSEVLELKKVSISGVIYASEKSLPHDSNIIFRRPGGSSQRVGRAKLIFQAHYVIGTIFLVLSRATSLRAWTSGMATGVLGLPEGSFVKQRRMADSFSSDPRM
jgi:hypothetical protein